MKYLIFSDSHLAKNFDPKKFSVLKKAIESSDRVIINGDFWEGFTTSFDELTKSKWAETLFPLLKKKQAIYLYGNHDKKIYSDKRTSLFSVEQRDEYVLKSGKNTFFIQHGDKYVILPDVQNWLCFILENTEDVLVKLFRKPFIKLAFGWMNTKIKIKVSSKLKKNEFLIVGHTHCAEIDLENHFINSGFIKHGLAQYLTIENGAITPHEESY
ncbi:MAG: metallophosphoesterase family protein [Patescibacteria group bacterium]|mgnify:CR=1 FL=1